MAYVVEDGTGLANANGYAELTFLAAYATERGVTVTDVAVKAIVAMDYLSQYDDLWIGEPATETQALAWPRRGAIYRGRELPADEVPVIVQNIQAALVVAQQLGADIMPNVIPPTRDELVIEKTIGPLTTKWADPTKVGIGDAPLLRTVDAYLSGLLRATTAFRSYRG